MVFGTFDILHPGHLHFFRQARQLARNPRLVVSVARDKNVRRIKGNEPLHNERQRLKSVKTCRLVDEAVLGGLKNHLPHILRAKPDIIALGYDQVNYVKGLKTALKNRGWQGMIVRLKPFKPTIYKSSLLKNYGNKPKFAIIRQSSH